jgi:hypothetical protein
MNRIIACAVCVILAELMRVSGTPEILASGDCMTALYTVVNLEKLKDIFVQIQFILMYLIPVLFTAVDVNEYIGNSVFLKMRFQSQREYRRYINRKIMTVSLRYTLVTAVAITAVGEVQRIGNQWNLLLLTAVNLYLIQWAFSEWFLLLRTKLKSEEAMVLIIAAVVMLGSGGIMAVYFQIQTQVSFLPIMNMPSVGSASIQMIQLIPALVFGLIGTVINQMMGSKQL